VTQECDSEWVTEPQRNAQSKLLFFLFITYFTMEVKGGRGGGGANSVLLVSWLGCYASGIGILMSKYLLGLAVILAGLWFLGAYFRAHPLPIFTALLAAFLIVSILDPAD